jgi:hypothetical protein
LKYHLLNQLKCHKDRYDENSGLEKPLYVKTVRVAQLNRSGLFGEQMNQWLSETLSEFYRAPVTMLSVSVGDECEFGPLFDVTFRVGSEQISQLINISGMDGAGSYLEFEYDDEEDDFAKMCAIEAREDEEN